MRAFRIAVVACLAAAVLGCGSRRASVTGTITYKGQPVKAAAVYFYFDQGGMYPCDLHPDGTYEMTDIPTGPVKVVVDNAAWDPEQKPATQSQYQQRMAKGYNKEMNEYDARMGRGGAATKKEEGLAAPGLSKEKKEELAKLYVKIPKKYANDKTTTLWFTVEGGGQTKNFDLTD